MQKSNLYLPMFYSKPILVCDIVYQYVLEYTYFGLWLSIPILVYVLMHLFIILFVVKINHENAFDG